MDKQPVISLCIPTNGIIEWVFPVLDSIFSQNVSNELFEVVVTDNGNNEEFKRLFDEYQKLHENLFYFRSSGYEFLSEPDSYKNAKGLFIKFINHRTKLIPGTLQYFINWVKQNIEEKPFVYFSNGVIGFKTAREYPDFDSFVKGLSYWSSWSTGMGFWKETFDSMSKDHKYNLLFPHTDILFSQRKLDKYVIDDSKLLDEIPQGKIPKGRYNLFNAFGVEYVGILSDLLRNGDISIDTFLYVKNANKKFIVNLYFQYVIMKRKCSYNLSNYKQSLDVFYTYKSVRADAIKVFIKRLVFYPLKFFKKIGKLCKFHF